jgi:hypothetical protein
MEDGSFWDLRGIWKDGCSGSRRSQIGKGNWSCQGIDGFPAVTVERNETEVNKTATAIVSDVDGSISLLQGESHTISFFKYINQHVKKETVILHESRSVHALQTIGSKFHRPSRRYLFSSDLPCASQFSISKGQTRLEMMQPESRECT